MSWKAVDRYSKDYVELQTKDKVRMYKTPDSVLQRQRADDEVAGALVVGHQDAHGARATVHLRM